MRARTVAALTAVFLLGFALRLHHLNRVPLRGDEAFTVIHWMREPLSVTLGEIALRDPQPPLAYAAYRGWGLLFDAIFHESTARLLPALLNLIGIPAMYALGKRLGGQRAGFAAAILWAIHPLQIWHAQDARNYALWAAATPLAIAAALRALKRGQREDWVLYVVIQSIAAYLYYLELFSIFVLTLYVLITHRRDRRTLITWFGALTAIGIILAPWYLQPRLFNSGYGGTAVGFDPLAWFTQFIPTLVLGETHGLIAAGGWLPALLTFGLIALWVIVVRTGRDRAALLGLLGVIPLLLIGLVALRLNVFVPRYVMPASIAYGLIIVLGLQTLYRAPRMRIPALAGASIYSGLILASLGAYFNPTYAKAPDWRALAAYLRVQVSAGDVVINTSADEAYTFYHDEAGIPASIERLPASERQPTGEIRAVLETIFDRAGAVWLAANTPAHWPNAGVVETWLADHADLVRDARPAGLRAFQYLPTEIRGSDLAPAPLAAYPSVTLLGSRVLRDDVLDQIVVILYWQPRENTNADLKTFIHLIGEINPQTGTPLWSQDDQFPRDGAVTSTDWVTQGLFRDIYHLPTAGLPAGTYTLFAGWYDPVTGERLLTIDGADSISIGQIERVQ